MAKPAAVIGIGQTKYKTRRDDVSLEGLVREVVSGRELIAYVRKVETSKKRVSIEELGKSVGADLVLYVEMDMFTLTPDGGVPKPSASARVKVVDVAAKERIFPVAGADQRGYPVNAIIDSYSADSFRSSAARRRPCPS